MKIQRRRSVVPRIIAFGGTFALVAVAAYGWWYFDQQRTQQPIQAPRVVAQKPADEQPSKALKVFNETPVRLEVGKIKVNAPIIPVGLEPDGAMQAPATQVDVGWYEKSAKVGAHSRHSVLLDGHYGTHADKGVFYRLHELTVDDTLTVHGSAGSKAVYKVVEMERAKLEDVDMKKAFYVYPEAQQSITLITCQGEYDTERATYDDRVVLYAVRIA